MSVYISAHMTSYPRGENAEKRYPELQIKLTHCVSEDKTTVNYVPEATTYERLKLSCDREGFDGVFFMQVEHLRGLHAALSEFLANYPEYAERGNNSNLYAEDVIKSSRDFAVTKPESKSTEKEPAE